MDSSEYPTMYRIEDTHWWYQALRVNIRQHWNECVSQDNIVALDIGCGTGANLAMVSSFARAFGIDISPDALRLTRQRGPFPVAQGTAEVLPFPNDTFGAALLMDVLYHRAVTDKAAPIREANRVLRPGGVLLINAPAFEWLRSSHDTHIHTDKRFTKREVAALIRDAGMEPVRVEYWNTLLFPAIAAVRLWRRMRPQPGSDLATPPGRLGGAVCGSVLALERTLQRLVPMPFGVSIFAVARKRL